MQSRRQWLWMLTAVTFEQCITPATRAVIPVDLYGHVPDLDAIREIAARHSIAVIEDAAEAIGSEYKGRKAGSFGDTVPNTRTRLIVWPSSDRGKNRSSSSERPTVSRTR